MLTITKNDVPVQKCIFTRGTLPGYIDEKQLPSRRKPFSSLLSPKWYHTVDLLLPAEVRDVVQRELEEHVGGVRYAKVMMSLREIVEGDFFTEYIKKGNISMLSEGRPGVDDLFSLHEGILSLELSKPTYERVGLVGKPIPDGGRKHNKTRYLIQLNLRLPSMLHGKKGFERIVWAFKNVLTLSLTWLFYDYNITTTTPPLPASPQPISTQQSAPINALSMHTRNPNPDLLTLAKTKKNTDKHHPIHLTSTPSSLTLHATRVPNFPFQRTTRPFATTTDSTTQPPPQQSTTAAYTDPAFPAALHEYLTLALLASPRIQDTDTIDPFLCRYSIPTPGTDIGSDYEEEEQGSYRVRDLVRMRWQGFIPSSVARRLFVVAKKGLAGGGGGGKGSEEMKEEEEGVEGGGWMVMQVNGFRGESVTMMKLPFAEGAQEEEFLEWEVGARL